MLEVDALGLSIFLATLLLAITHALLSTIYASRNRAIARIVSSGMLFILPPIASIFAAVWVLGYL
jgi:hypothetical protein